MPNSRGQEAQCPEIAIGQRIVEVPVDDLDAIVAHQPKQSLQGGRLESSEVQRLDGDPLLRVPVHEVGVERRQVNRQEEAATFAEFTGQHDRLFGQRRKLAGRIELQYV